MRVAGALVAGLCVSACSLLTSLDDLRGGAGDAGPGSIAFVQGRAVHDSSSKQTSRSIPVSIPNVTAHHAIVVGVIALQSGPALNTINISDDRGDTFVPAGPITSYDGWVNSIVAGAFDVAGGSSIITVDVEGTAIEASDVFVAEYSGITANDAMSYGTGDTPGLDGVVASPVATTGATDLIVGLAYSDGSASEGTEFTKRFANSDHSSIFEDRITTSAGTYGATATMGPTGSYWVIVMGAFK